MTLPEMTTRVSLIVVTASVATIVLGGSVIARAAPAAYVARPVSAVSAQALAATGSPVSLLPVGPAPVGIPYAIGKRMYLNGKLVYDFTARWTALVSVYADVQFGDVKITRGVIVWSVNEDRGAGDPLARVGVLRAGGSPIVVHQVSDYPGLATTTGGLISSGLAAYMADSTGIFNLAGVDFGPPFTYTNYIPFPGPNITVQSAGGSFVFQGVSATAPLNTPLQSYSMYPGHPAVQLPYDNTFGAGSGTGWLVTANNPTSGCFRTAALATPAVLRAPICSQTPPLVSDDGTMAVVVQANHVGLYNTVTGAQINAANAPTLTTQGYSPFAWESPTSYLVNASQGSSVYILRCSTTTGACQRAVTSYTRPGVKGIID